MNSGQVAAGSRVVDADFARGGQEHGAGASNIGRATGECYHIAQESGGPGIMQEGRVPSGIGDSVVKPALKTVDATMLQSRSCILYTSPSPRH